MVLDSGRFNSSELANVTQMLDEHFRVALSATKMVTGAMTAWLEQRRSISKEDLAKITALEEKGDELKRAMLKVLSSAHTLMQREDLLRLIHYNDKIVDAAEICCYHLAAVTGSWIPEGELRTKVAELGRMTNEIVTEQREAVRFLPINIETSIVKADEICRIEKRIDAQWRDVVSLLYPSAIPLAIVLRFRDFVMQLEELANLSEDAAITIRGLSLTLNT
jgi:predicted phosphate transport protein (TIGR00153 family)